MSWPRLDSINMFRPTDPVQGLYGRDMSVFNPQWARWFDTLKEAGVNNLSVGTGMSPAGSNQLRGTPTYARQGARSFNGSGNVFGLGLGRPLQSMAQSGQTPLGGDQPVEGLRRLRRRYLPPVSEVE